MFGGLLDGLADKLSVKHGAQSEGVMNGAVLIFHGHPLIVPELRKHDANEQWMTVGAGNKDRAATVAGKGGEIR